MCSDNIVLIECSNCGNYYCGNCVNNASGLYQPSYDEKITGISKEEYMKIIADKNLYEETIETNEFFRLYEIARIDYEELKKASIKCPMCLK